MTIADSRKRNLQAVGYMTLSVVGFSLVPTRGVSESPFLFNAGWRLGFGFGLLVFLMVSNRSLVGNQVVWGTIWEGLRGKRWWMIWLATISQFEYAVFAWSDRFVDISVTTVLFEFYHVLVILFTAWLFRHERRYQETGRALLLIFVVVVGFAFVVSAQTGRFVGFGEAASSSLVSGALLALLAAAIAACSACNFRWGAELGQELAGRPGIGRSRDSLDLFFVVMASSIANAFAMPFNLVAVGISSEPMDFGILLAGIFGGLIFNAMANILWRKANLMTNNLGINAIAYATPILSIGWLFLFSEVSVPRVDYLIIGAAAVFTANLLINFEAEKLLGFKALVLALWACGTAVYLRGVDGWRSTGAGGIAARAAVPGDGTRAVECHVAAGTVEPGVAETGEDGHGMVAPQPADAAPSPRPDKPDHLKRNATHGVYGMAQFMSHMLCKAWPHCG